MNKRILIIDDSATLRARIARLLDQEIAGADITEYNIEKLGWRPSVVKYTDYDVLIISSSIDNKSILDWWQSLDRQDFPATILLHKDPDEAYQQQALEQGIFKCLNKSALTRSILSKAVHAAFELKNDYTGDNSNLSPLDTLNRPSLDEYNPPDETQRKLRKPRPRPLNQPRKRFSTKSGIVSEVPGYDIIDKVGQGGMSVIYLAEREQDNKKVVIKVLSANLSENDVQVVRSNQEYKLISRINSPHIVKLYDHGVVEGSTYTVMEYFSSGDLKQRMLKGITQVQALKFLQQICTGLAAIHGSGVIHRDLKPANIMFREDDTLAIIDFGISRDINSQLNLTQPGQIIGTPNYMAPEQGSSSYKPDARSDIYAVGVMLYEMLTGKKPYRAANASSIIYKHVNDPIPKLPNQFFEMQGIVDNCMAKFPHQRFQSAFDMIDYIQTEFRWDITLDFE